MNYLLNIMDFISGQNETERILTIFSLIFMVFLLLYMIIDYVIKGKYVPRNKTVRTVIFIMFILAFGALILIKIYYK